MTLSTHILDTALGRPARDVPVRLDTWDGVEWTAVTSANTDQDGRIAGWNAAEGVHRLVFDTGAYLGEGAFYPEVVVVFRVTAAAEHYHVPLLISPYGYSTYRGS